MSYRSEKSVSFVLLIVSVMILITGFSLLPLLSVQLEPSRTLPSLSIQYNWPQSSPEVMEQELTSPMEALFSTVRGIHEIHSQSAQGYGQITIDFDDTQSMQTARAEINELIRQAYRQFPVQASYPVISMHRPDDETAAPVLSYTLVGQSNSWALQEFAQTHISPQLSLLDGLDKVMVSGGQPMQWEIAYDGNLLRTHNLSPNELLQAITNYFNRENLGEVQQSQSGLDSPIHVLITHREQTAIPDWTKIPITALSGRIIYLGQLARVREVEQPPSSYYRINGLTSIQINLFALPQSNSLQLADRIKEKIAILEHSLPDGARLMLMYDSTEELKEELHVIYSRTGLTIFILLLFTWIVSRNYRYTLIIAFSLLVNFALSLIIYYLFDVQVHLYSMAGITVSLGLIIDNSIVMVDHLRHTGNRNVFLALLAATLTSVAALLVVYFLPREIRLNLVDFGSVIIINLVSSLFVSLFIVPAAVHFLPIKKSAPKSTYWRRRWVVRYSQKYLQVISVVKNHKLKFLTATILLFGLPVHLLPSYMGKEGVFSTLYNNTVGSDFYKSTLKPYTEKALGGTLRLFSLYVFDSGFYADKQETVLSVYARLPLGTTLEQANDVFIRLENYVGQYPEVSRFITQIDHGQSASMQIYFTRDAKNTSFPYILKNRLIAQAIDFGGITWSIYGVGKGFDNYSYGAPVNYKVGVYGYNFDQLQHEAERMRQALLEHPRIHKVDIDASESWSRQRPDELIIQPDNALLAAYDFPVSRLLTDLRNQSPDRFPDAAFSIGGKHTYISLYDVRASDFDKWMAHNTLLQYNGVAVKPGEVLSWQQQAALDNIYKRNQQYIKVLNYEYTGASKFGDQYLDEVMEKMKTEFPLGYSAKKLQAGYFFMFQNKDYDYRLIILVIALIFLVSSVLLESLRQSIALMLLIPFSFVGVFLTFYWFDINFDQGGFASFVVLAGISINPALYIINDWNALMKRYQNPNAVLLYVKAFNQKIVPSMLTVLSTILGLVPFLLGGQTAVFWYALAAGVIGGSVFALIGLWLVLPVFILKNRA